MSDEQFFIALTAPELSLPQVQRLCFGGVPDHLRAQFWKLLLGYAPLDVTKREESLQAQRAQYRVYLEELSRRPPGDMPAWLRAELIANGSAEASSFSSETDAPQHADARSAPEAAGEEGQSSSNSGGAAALTTPANQTRRRSVLGVAAVAPAEEQVTEEHGTTPRPSMSLPAGEGEDAEAPVSSTMSSGGDGGGDGAATPVLAPAASPSDPADTTASERPPSPPDSPLLSPSSLDRAWREWQRDTALRDEINLDLHRTNPGLHFFAVKRNLEAMCRILFVYAKLNSGVRYVQGMNELLAPIWYVFAQDETRRQVRTTAAPDPVDGGDAEGGSSGSGVGRRRGSTSTGAGVLPLSPAAALSPSEVALDDAEADAFFCFCRLMAEVRDVFIREHDASPTGVKGMITRFSMVLTRREPEVSRHLAALRLDHYYYAFRWLTTMLSREFTMPDVLALWDTLFADPHRFSFLLYACVGMIRLVRHKLLAADFPVAMRLLQNYPPLDFAAVFKAAVAVRAEDAAEGYISLAAPTGPVARTNLGALSPGRGPTAPGGSNSSSGGAARGSPGRGATAAAGASASVPATAASSNSSSYGGGGAVARGLARAFRQVASAWTTTPPAGSSETAGSSAAAAGAGKRAIVPPSAYISHRLSAGKPGTAGAIPLTALQAARAAAVSATAPATTPSRLVDPFTTHPSPPSAAATSQKK